MRSIPSRQVQLELTPPAFSPIAVVWIQHYFEISPAGPLEGCREFGQEFEVFMSTLHPSTPFARSKPHSEGGCHLQRRLGVYGRAVEARGET